MKSLDTNVLARFFIDDKQDPEAIKQRPAAVATLSQRCWVSVTVLLEFEWVMRGFYGLARRDISRVLRALVGIEHLSIDDRAGVLQAIDGFDAGLDFADALHLARSTKASGFVTFDRKLAKRSEALGLAPKVELPA